MTHDMTRQRAAFKGIEEMAEGFANLATDPALATWFFMRSVVWAEAATAKTSQAMAHSLHVLVYDIGPFMPAVLKDLRVLQHLTPFVRIEA
jgi:hypothetical protein